MKRFSFKGVEFTITRNGHYYCLNGIHVSDPFIWDYCDDAEEHPVKYQQALRMAYRIVSDYELYFYSNHA